MSTGTMMTAHPLHSHKPSPFLAALVLLATPIAAHTADWQTASVNVVGVENYFAETCIEVKPQQTLSYRFSSEHPVNFNIHYHPGNSVVFVTQKESLTEFAETLNTGEQQHYCFTWTNLVDRQQQTWPVTLQYQLIQQ